MLLVWCQSDPDSLVPAPLRVCCEWLEKHAEYTTCWKQQEAEDTDVLYAQFEEGSYVIDGNQSTGVVTSLLLRYLKAIPYLFHFV